MNAAHRFSLVDSSVFRLPLCNVVVQYAAIVFLSSHAWSVPITMKHALRCGFELPSRLSQEKTDARLKLSWSHAVQLRTKGTVQPALLPFIHHLARAQGILLQFSTQKNRLLSCPNFAQREPWTSAAQELLSSGLDRAISER